MFDIDSDQFKPIIGARLLSQEGLTQMQNVNSQDEDADGETVPSRGIQLTRLRDGLEKVLVGRIWDSFEAEHFLTEEMYDRSLQRRK